MDHATGATVGNVDPVHLVGLVQPNKRDKPNKPNNGLLVLADFFSILLSKIILSPAATSNTLQFQDL